MDRYSFWTLARNAVSGHRKLRPAWRRHQPKSKYDVLIVGAGGHGLATAYYLASRFGGRNIAVLERGWVGGGNVARNTVTVRSNYLRDESIPFFARSVRMFGELSRELNYNLMHSRRTMIDIVQTSPKLRELKRRMKIMDMHGSSYEEISVSEVRRRIPALTGAREGSRLPIIAGMVHKDAAVNRHDAVAWAYARAADSLGVEIHQNTEVTSLVVDSSGRISGVETKFGTISARKVALAVSGHTFMLARTAGLGLPLRTFNLTAFVSEPIKPVVDVVVNCPDLGCYFSQTARGELIIGGHPDPGLSYRRDIKQNVFEGTVSGLLELFPSFGRLKLLRQWGGHLDIAPDGSPIIDRTSVGGLFVTAGWWGGYKAIPAGGLCLAKLIATGEHHRLASSFTLARFDRLDYIMEAGTTTVV
ncbi:MAG: FAD-dependent oxidoreductase [Rhodobacteraceae bacterium]|nr:FAD-dependent oxidoreductase [Paracoccaceae bacterium]